MLASIKNCYFAFSYNYCFVCDTYVLTVKYDRYDLIKDTGYRHNKSLGKNIFYSIKWDRTKDYLVYL